MRRLLTVLVVLGVASWSGWVQSGGTQSSGAQAGGWVQWRGQNRDGKSLETGLLKDWPQGGPPQLWRVAGAGAGYSSFAAAGGRLFTLGNRNGKEYVLAFDEATGAKVWETVNGAAFTNDRGDGPRSTPTVDGERLFALGASGDLSCLELLSGKLIWKKNVLKEFRGENPYWGLSESPLVLNDRVLINAGGQDGGLVAFNKATGAVLWKSERDPAGYSSAVLARVGPTTQAVFMTEQRAVGVDVATGKVLWSYDRASNNTANIATPIVSGDRVFVSSAYDTGGALLQLSPAGGAREVYFTRALMTHQATAVLVGDHLFGFSNSILAALRFSDGKLAWQHRSVGKGSVIWADGRLYLFSENGVMALAEANPAQYVEHGRFRIGQGELPTWSHPIISNGKLILRDQGTIYAFDIKAK